MSDMAWNWGVFCKAIGTELRSDQIIRGQSGLDHHVQAIAVDDKAKRVLVVSAEANPRTAALMQVDIQATLPDARVLVARPLAFDVVAAVKRIVEPLGLSKLEFDRARKFFNDLQKMPPEEAQDFLSIENRDDILENAIANVRDINFPIETLFMNFVAQAANFPWRDLMKVFDESSGNGMIDFGSFLASDTISADLRAGVCPIPLYLINNTEMELFGSESKVDECRDVLKRIGVYQYFFPAPDHLILGLIDKGLRDASDVVNLSGYAPEQGHPFGAPEIIDTPVSLLETLGQLKDMGFIGEGEFGMEISPEGNTVRANVKFKPRESLITKLINRFSFSASISPKDFLGS